MSLLTVADVHTSYGEVNVLKGVNLIVDEGEIVTLIGSNGAGKTTTLNTISGVTPAREGSIIFDGYDITQLPPYEIIRRGVVQSPEGRKIFARLTVLENLEMGAFSRHDARAVRRDLDFVFERFPHLSQRLYQLGGTLSGGEQQMLAIARALMARPRLLLLDEPSMGLAPMLVREIFELIIELSRAGTTILLVEQNAHMALAVAQRAYVMQSGTIAYQGEAHQLRRDPVIIDAYLGGMGRE